MPHKPPNPLPRSLVDDAAHWHFRGKQMRALAEQMMDEETRAIMLRLAGDYDLLAERAAVRQMASPRPPPSVASFISSRRCNVQEFSSR